MTGQLFHDWFLVDQQLWVVSIAEFAVLSEFGAFVIRGALVAFSPAERDATLC